MMIQFLAGALVIRLGLAIYAAGSVRSKNVGSLLGRQVLDWAISMLAFWAVGGAISRYAGDAVVGLNASQLFSTGSPVHHFTLFAMVSLFGPIVIGATAERSCVWPMFSLSIVSAAIIMPIAFNWVDHGWLMRNNFLDGVGGASIHVAGAVMAWVAVRFVGARDGKYHRDGSTSMIPGHSLPMILIGAWLAIAGSVIVLGANMGTNAAFVTESASNLILSIAASTLICAGYFQFRFSKVDLPMLAASALGGWVAITASGGSVHEPAAVAIGAVAGLLVSITMVKLDLVLKLDDVTGAVAVHGVAGAWGVLAAGLFRADALGSRLARIGIQAGGLLAIAALSFAVTWVTLKAISLVTPLRVSGSEEFDGLDLSEHDVGPYPDFQQNTIKSFHLREQ